MAELLSKVDHKTYLDLPVGVARVDRIRRVGTVTYKGHKAAEIRDWVEVMDEDGENLIWHPSSGVIIPLDQVVKIRKALQKIEVDNGLVDEEV
ncbi:hypothetical protein [Microbispora sp. NPDC049633]|uniref:hypothetical protein n=1 Tax=Microbispora sp. NPDC049633 TaxID=3154355 RepID=UPI0034198C04